MGVAKKVLIEEFEAVSDSGKVFQIRIYQELIDAGSWKNPNATVEGLQEARTSTGQFCNRIDDNTFDILDAFGKIRVKRV